MICDLSSTTSETKNGLFNRFVLRLGYNVVKRVCNILFSVIALVLLSPVILIIIVLILASPQFSLNAQMK